MDGVSRSAIYHGNCNSNELTPIRFGRAVRFLRIEVEAFERDRETATRKNPGLLQAMNRVGNDTLPA